LGENEINPDTTRIQVTYQWNPNQKEKPMRSITEAELWLVCNLPAGFPEDKRSIIKAAKKDGFTPHTIRQAAIELVLGYDSDTWIMPGPENPKINHFYNEIASLTIKQIWHKRTHGKSYHYTFPMLLSGK